MSRFQATISTFAAIGTIGLTVVAVYRAVDDQKQRDLRNQEEIQTLRNQLKQQLEQQKSGETSEPPPAPAVIRPLQDNPAEVAPVPPSTTSEAAPAAPPPLPPVPEAAN